MFFHQLSVFISPNCDVTKNDGQQTLSFVVVGIKSEDYLPNPSFAPVPTVCFHHVSSLGHCPPLGPGPGERASPYSRIKWKNINIAN